MIHLYTDGGARGNPGPAAIGIVALDECGKIYKQKEKIGKTTNNVAEYTALIKGLNLLLKANVKEVNCFSDSELMVKQLNGEYKIKSSNLIPLFEEVERLSSRFDEIKFFHVPRTNKYIRIADALVNQALDV